VLILAAPGQAASNTAAPVSGNYILRLSTSDVPRFMYASDNTSLWFSLRPQQHAKPTPQSVIRSSNFFTG
jgi:hypothetical protein